MKIEEKNSMDDSPSQPLIKNAPARKISTVWLIPLLAFLMATWMVYQHYSSLGPLITISFSSAEGLEANKTPVRFRSVEVGKVKSIEIDEDIENVLVSVRMVDGSEDFLNQHSRFWVVRPRVSFVGVSGLSTLLSGSYIAMSTRADGGESETVFTGMEEPPLTPDDIEGIHVRLIAPEGASLSPGAPVLHRQVEVGSIGGQHLLDDGQGVEISAFINAPYDKLINSNTRFWSISSFNVTVGADGISVATEPLSTLISGGIAFDTPRRLATGTAIESNAIFPLFDDRQKANLNTSGSDIASGYVLNFDESLRGLSVGAPVEYRGVKVGHVADISIHQDSQNGTLSVPVLIFLEPESFGVGKDQLAMHELIDRAIENGMRAQIQTASLLTGQLFIELAMSDDKNDAEINPGQPYAEFPTIKSPFNQITATASGVLAQLGSVLGSADQLIRDADTLLRVPSDEELGENPDEKRAQLSNAPAQQMLTKVNSALDGLNKLLGTKEMESLPENLGNSLKQLDSTLRSVKRVLEGDAARSPLYYELSNAMKELTKASRAVRELTQTLDEKPNSLFFGND